MRGFCAVGVSHPKKEVNVGTLWRTAAIFDTALMFTVGHRFIKQPGDTLKAWRHTPMLHFVDVADLVAHLPYDASLVGIEQDESAISLGNYCHPERVCYLLGAEDWGLSQEERESCDQIVSVPTPRPFSLNVAVAGSVVLYDRLAKNGAEVPVVPPIEEETP